MKTLNCLLLFSLFLLPDLGRAAQVPVHFSEGMARGFLVATDSKGTRLASGDFLQTRDGGEVKSRTLLHFKDGSVHDETAVFTQDRHFLLKSYRLIQKGPSFKDEMDVTVDRDSGTYTIKTKAKDKAEKVLTGKLDLPADVYNGMVPTVVKNLKSSKQTVHIIGFTPAPRVLELDIVPSDEAPVLIGDLKKSALHYVLKPKLGILKVPAAILGKTPPDDHLWIITSDVPAFVRFQGPLYNEGPVWRVELTSPVWPK